MLSGERLAGEREQWITQVCGGLVGALEAHPVLARSKTAYAPHEQDLVCALLIAQIAALAAEGRSKEAIIQTLATNPLLVGTGSQREQLTDLVTKIHIHMELDGITSSPWLLNCALRAWSPESAYRLLVELWSARRLGAGARSSQVSRELARYWGVKDRDRRDVCLSRPFEPLRDYPSIWETLQVEPDKQVGNLTALALRGNSSSQRLSDLWADRLLSITSPPAHILSIGHDLIDGIQAGWFLRRVRDRSDTEMDLDLRKPAIRALEIIGDHLTRVRAAVDGLSTLERELLHEHTSEEHFQDRCLEALLNWSFATRSGAALYGSGTVHGMWGALPWWTMTVLDDDHERAAAAALAEGTLPLGFENNSACPEHLDLICRRPRTSEPGLRARFTFDLTNPVHACELLLIGRRGQVCIDAIREPRDEDSEPALVQMGTLKVPVGDELAQHLTEIASSALWKLLGEDWGPGVDECASLSLSAVPWQISGYNLAVYPPARKILVAEASNMEGEITADTNGIPTTMSPRNRPKRPSGSASSDLARQSWRVRHQVGFVYLGRDPGKPEMLKIGFTERMPEDRAGDLSGSQSIQPFKVLYRTMTSRPRKVEKTVHRLLEAHRVVSNREYFHVDQQAAEDAIRYCQELTTGIDSWEKMPTVHRLRAGDRVVLPLKAGQIFAVTGRLSFLQSSAELIDVWQAHASGDVLELFVTGDPGKVRGMSDNDPDAHEDPVPFLDRKNATPNGWLIGRERLMAGDRLVWLEGCGDTTRCVNAVFEIEDFCQVTCRSWNPKSDSSGMPLLLNYVTQSASESMIETLRDALELRPPRTWAPRNPSPDDDWIPAATDSPLPEHWLTQLKLPRRRR